MPTPLPEHLLQPPLALAFVPAVWRGAAQAQIPPETGRGASLLQRRFRGTGQREISGIKYLFAAAMALTALPSLSATNILITPRLSPTDPLAVPACTTTIRGNTNALCTASGQNIGYDFGSTTELAVRHSHAGATDHGIVFQSGLGPYLPAFGHFTGQSDFGVITFTPLAGFEVRFLGFDTRRGTNTGTQGEFALFDSADQQIWSLTTGNLSNSSFTAVTVGSDWSANALRFTYDQVSGGFTVVSNFALEVREVSAIPEPGSWALMLAGMAGLGWLQRRRLH